MPEVILGSGPSALIPKSQVTIPLSPTRPVTDTLLFTDAQDANRTYYLPRYRIATERVAEQQQFRIGLTKTAQGGLLQVVLEQFPAPALGTTARDATPLPHTLDVRIQFVVPIGNAGRIRKELTVSEIVETTTGTRLTWSAADLNELTQLYQAMTDADYEAILVIERAVQVAIPISSAGGRLERDVASVSLLATGFTVPQHFTLPQQIAVPGPLPVIRRPPIDRDLGDVALADDRLPSPILQLTGVEEYEVRGNRFRRFQLRVENWNAYPAELFAPAPDLPPCGANTNSSRTWVDILDTTGGRIYGFCALRNPSDLQQLWFAVPVGQIPPAGVSVALRDRRRDITYRSQIVSTQLSEDANHALKLTVPTRNKAADDQHDLPASRLSNVNPGDTVTLVVEFPDQPTIPRADSAGQTKIEVVSSPGPISSTWMQPVEGAVTTDAGFAFVLDHIRLFGSPDGRVVAFTVGLGAPALDRPARLRSLTVTFRVPANILSFPIAPNQTIPVTAVRWQGLAVESEPFYEVGAETGVAQEPLPFLFDKSLHGYIYRDILVDPGQQFGLTHYQEPWDGREHFYFQDEAQRDVLYYLPDVFKLRRNRTLPYTPDLLLRFDLTDAGAQATLRYRAVPVVDPARLADAARKLKPRLRNLSESVTDLTFKPLIFADAVTYKLALPRHDSTLGPYQARPQAQVDLSNGIEDLVVMNMEDFAIVFDSLLTPRASLFSGNVEITLDDLRLPAIPLHAKFYDLVGETVLIERSEEHANQETVTLRNATESPLRIQWLTAQYVTATGEILPAAVTDLTLPTDLAAGEDLHCQVIKPAQLRGGAQPRAELQFDLTGVEVHPDAEALWDAILDPALRPEYQVDVSVRTEADVLARNGAIELIVEFPGRTTVVLTPDLLETTATIYVPVRDYVLKTAEAVIYRYRLQVVHGTHIARHVTWQSFTSNRLRITDAELPKEGD